MSKECKDCKEIKDLSLFYVSPTNKGGVLPRCKPCENARNTKWGKENPERRKLMGQRSNYKRYGITPEQVEEMRQRQNRKCAICLGEEEDTRSFHLDHNHSTLKIRDLLCGSCNRALGLVREDIKILKNMITYLEKHKG